MVAIVATKISNATFRSATYSAKIKPYLKCGRKLADALASGGVNFRPE
jgi:hypothetical protein